MSKNQTHYFFTNQRNILQAITKGYICNIEYWDRKADDFSDAFSFPPKDYLWFSKSLLNLPYTFITDKTLLPVAVGLGEKQLEKLGFQKIVLPDDSGSLYIGDEIIPVDLIDVILFKSQEDLSRATRGYGKYLELLDQDVYKESKENEFETLIDIPKDLDCKIPKHKLSSEIETHISRQIGAVGNYLIDLIDNDENTYLLFSDIVSYYLNNLGSTIPINELKDNIQSVLPDYTIKDEELLLIAVLFISNSFKDLETQIKVLVSFGNKTQLKIADYQYDLLYILLNTFDTVLVELKEDIKVIDRIELLSKIRAQLVKNLEKNKSIKGQSVLSIFDEIKNVFDYKSELNDAIDLIDNLDCVLLKQFLRGFELYIREPINLDKIKIAADNETNLPSNLCKAIPAYIWGKARGSFAFKPEKKRNMLNVVHDRNFYSMVFSKQQFEDYKFSLLPHKGIVDKDETEKISLGKYELYYNVSEPIEKSTYEEHEYSFSTKNGLNFQFIKEDKFEDVLESINKVIDGKKSLEDKDLKFFIKEYFKSDITVAFGKQKLTIEKEQEVDIDEEIIIRYPGELDLTMKMPKNILIEKIEKLLRDDYSKSNYDRIKLSEKKKLRNHYSSIKKTENTGTKSENNISKKDFKLPVMPNENSTVNELKIYLRNKGHSGLNGLRKNQLLERVKLISQQELNLL